MNPPGRGHVSKGETIDLEAKGQVQRALTCVIIHEKSQNMKTLMTLCVLRSMIIILRLVHFLVCNDNQNKIKFVYFVYLVCMTLS